MRMKQANFFMRAGSATVRPTEGAGGTLGSLGGFSVTNNTQLGLTFTYMATDNIGVELLAATPFRHKIGTRRPAILQPFIICRQH